MEFGNLLTVLEPVGRLATASNATLLCRVRLAPDGPGDPAADPLEGTCVHKPIRGEAPLWDFPDGTLAAREVAAYENGEIDNPRRATVQRIAALRR